MPLGMFTTFFNVLSNITLTSEENKLSWKFCRKMGLRGDSGMMLVENAHLESSIKQLIKFLWTILWV